MTDRVNYGSRIQVAALIRQLNDVEGNRDGIVNNESLPAGVPKDSFTDGNPLLNRKKLALEPGFSTGDELSRLSQYVDAKERAWGQPISRLPPTAIENFDGFRAEKAMALDRFGRSPGDVTEGFTPARGSVDGQRIEDRDIFWQRWKPVGAPSGKVVVVSPGFQETGRNFYEQIDKLNRQGHEVVVMDHQWAGYSQGGKGGIDRGYGVARDVAAVTAMAQQVADAEFGNQPHEVMLLGNSMGAGPGVLGALALNDAGKIQLDGPQMPKGLNAVLQSPYVAMTPSAINKTLELASHVPGVSDIPLPSTGVPVLTNDPVAANKGAQHVALDDVSARPQAMSAATEDMQSILRLIESRQGPRGRMYIVQGDRDPLADPQATKHLADTLGSRVHLNMVQSGDHVLEESPTLQRHAVDGVNWLATSR